MSGGHKHKLNINQQAVRPLAQTQCYMQPQNETKMDYYFAMFNCHKNNALEKTCNKFKEIWTDKKFESKIQPIIEAGVMSIFQEKPNKYTKFFVFYNRDIVNGERS